MIPSVLLADVVRVSEELAGTARRKAKIDLLAGILARLEPGEITIAVGFLTGSLRQGTVGVGYATLRRTAPPASGEELTLADVDGLLTTLAATSGPGSAAGRRRVLDELFGRATASEQQFLTRLLLGDLRQGALEGVMVEAVARAAAVPPAAVRRAAMVRGDLAPVAEAALAGGVAALDGFHLEVLRAVQPMLAQSAASLEEALAVVGRAALEWKLDGARLQVHRRGDEVRVFTRNLADVTERIPEVVEIATHLPVDSAVLDAEVIALRPDGRPQPFQVTMSRFGTKQEVARQRARLPLTPFFFDCLHLGGRDVLHRPGAERWEALVSAVPEPLRVPRIVTGDPGEAERFFADSLARGHEGVMVKSLDAPYEAGRRGAGWLKVKPVHTLDLVVLAAEWGSGRRRGWLSNLHLGARDPGTGGFVMLGKTFKGLTDEMLQWQTDRFLELETRREQHVVHVRPEQIVEIAFDGIQASSRYPGGMALRFARVKGYRLDKTAAEADTIDTVRAIFRGG